MESEENLKLVFVNRIGTNHDGMFEFELYYSDTPDTVWAEDFAEQVPSTCAIEDMIPNIDTYNMVKRCISAVDIKLAQENSCFSMQDCIDGILKLIWIEDNDGNYYGLDFGTDIEDAEVFLKNYGMELGEPRFVNTDKGNRDDIDDEGNNAVDEDSEASRVNDDGSEDFNSFNGEIDDNDDIDLEALYNGEF